MSPGSFNAAGRGARAATLIAGPIMNALLAIVLFAASFMAGFPASVSYPQLTAVAPNSVAANWVCNLATCSAGQWRTGLYEC
ncbi:MAG: site-2 protease family protein [Caldilineaceae bacterium]